MWMSVNERQKVKTDGSTFLTYTWLCGELEHLRDRCHWCWTYVFHTTVGVVVLTLVFMGIYITPLTLTGH
jgi:hypothetical protein